VTQALTTSREALEAAQARKLAGLLKTILPTNRFYARKLAGVAASAVPGPSTTPGATLARLPFTTKADLEEDQRREPPFGSNRSFPLAAYTRIHHTSGTTGRSLWWLDTPESWGWCLGCWTDIYRAAGVTAADRVFFPFSFGPFIGFWAAFESAGRLGCLTVPGGGMTTAARLRVLIESGATVMTATPTYALRMAEAAREAGVDLAASAVRVLIVAGEPGGSIPATRERLESSYGARVYDHCGMTETGPFGYECAEGPGGMHVFESEFIVEVIDPGTGEAAPRLPGGQTGELVITSLGRTASPVIRYRTGDLVCWSHAPCACGSPNGRLEGGILSRIDDMVFIRGNNVHPSAIEGVLRRFAEVAEYRVRVASAAEMTALELEIEPVSTAGAGAPAENLRRRVEAEMERTFLFKSRVTLVPPGTLPRFELKARRFVKADLPQRDA
jgi:phenylacetate-CoA ligase